MWLLSSIKSKAIAGREILFAPAAGLYCLEVRAGTVHLHILNLYPLPTVRKEGHAESKTKKKEKKEKMMIMFAEYKRDSRQCLTT